MCGTFFPEVVQVVPEPDYHVLVYFNDGKIVEKDMRDSMQGPIFDPLHDPAIFRDACCVMNGTLAWDVSGKRDPRDVVDIDPVVLHALPSVNDKWANAS